MALDRETSDRAHVDAVRKRGRVRYPAKVEHQQGAQTFFANSAISIKLRALPAHAHVLHRLRPARQLTEFFNATERRAIVHDLK